MTGVGGLIYDKSSTAAGFFMNRIVVIFMCQQLPVSEKRAGSFDPVTVRILETWYATNIRHPYPDDVTLSTLASAGGISVKQTRKWLANRRVRTGNTLTYNGAVHPRRRLQRQHTRTHQTVDKHHAATPCSTSRHADVTHYTSTPLPAVSCRRPKCFEVYSRDHTSSTPICVHQRLNFIARRVASPGSADRICMSSSSLLPHPHSFATEGTAAVNVASVHHMSIEQLSNANMFNSV